MNFTLGYIAGIVTAGLVFTILAFFRAGIERKVKIIETKLNNAGPQPRGAVFVPDDEAEIARRKFIEKNRKQGKDTKLNDLR